MIHTNKDHISRFLSVIMDPVAGLTEFRVLRSTVDYKTNFIIPFAEKVINMGGFYDRPDYLLCDCQRLRRAIGYLTVNPVSESVLAHGKNRTVERNKFLRIYAGEWTNDNDIKMLRWLFIDIDRGPIEGGSKRDSSATDAEFKCVIERRDAILSAEPNILDSSFYGCSGNGAWILTRLDDLPNDEANREHVHAMLRSLRAKYSDSVAHIDIKTANPSRIMGIPGTMKCKGEDTPERPWRMATIDGGPGL